MLLLMQGCLVAVDACVTSSVCEGWAIAGA